MNTEQIEILKSKCIYKKSDLGFYITVPAGPLFWTTSNSKEEALEKLIQRLKGGLKK